MPEIPLDPRKARAATRRRTPVTGGGSGNGGGGGNGGGPPSGINITGNAPNEVLKWDGTKWVSAPVSLITTTQPVAIAGAIYQSGDYLYFYTGTAWRKVTG